MGSATIRVVVGEFLKGEKNPKIIGVGEAPALGMRHGYVKEPELAVTALRRALDEAEKSSGIKIRRAFVAVGSVTLRGEISSGETVISKADGEVTHLDVSRALVDAEDNLRPLNKKVIQNYPLAHKIDGKEIMGRPHGMKGTKLESRNLFITCSNQHLEDLLEVVALCGVKTIDVVPTPIAGSYLSLSQKQKMVGSALVDIGSETVSLAVFENGILSSLMSFPIGGNDVTNDIALGFKISLEEAEGLKLGSVSSTHSQRKLDEIIEARMFDIFELVENHLKKIKRSELLPAGIVFIGGGANVAKIEEYSKSALKLPSRVGVAEMLGNSKTKLRDPAWFSALGLLLHSQSEDIEDDGSIGGIVKDLKNLIKSSIRQLMP